MHILAAHKWLTASLIIVVLLVSIILWQFLYIKYHHGAPVLAPTIPRSTEQLGEHSTPLDFVVMGDSTSIGQGAHYEQSIARQSALYLATDHQVALTNVGISGARVADVLHSQVSKAVALKPDVVLLAIGANDVTHLTSLGTVRHGITAIITQLRTANPHVKIVLTGSPAMGSVSRFAPPTQWLAGWRVKQINGVFADVARQKHVVLVPLAAKTAAAFKHNPSLFASDNFHPNAAGYDVWQPVINAGLAQVISAK